jgi:hypothetical protein
MGGTRSACSPVWGWSGDRRRPQLLQRLHKGENERQERGAPPDVVTVVGGPALAQPSERERRGRAEKRKLGEK